MAVVASASGCSSILGIEDLEAGGPFTLQSPNGGELFALESEQTITWTSEGTSGRVDIVLLRDGQPELTLVEDLTDTGSFTWTVPTTIPNSGTYRVRIDDTADSALTDESDEDFGIASWRFRTPINVNNRSNRNNQDYPMVIKLTPDNFDYSHANADGSDLRFSSNMEQSMGFDLPHFVEEWQPGGESFVWVRGDFAPSSNTSLFLFHGNELANDGGTVEDVFTSRFVSTPQEQVITETMEVQWFEIQQGHRVVVRPPAAPAAPQPILIVAEAVVIHGTLDATGAGHPGGLPEQSGQGPGGGVVGVGGGGSGGGFGGRGGAGGFDVGDTRASGGGSYGDPTRLLGEMGSGGSGSHSGGIATPVGRGGAGGGGITLNGTSRVVIGEDGQVLADGAPGESINGNSGGGGSGGHIIILGTHIRSTGTLSARGGDGGRGPGGANDDGGGGAGGRIVIAFDETNSARDAGDVSAGLGGPLGGAAGGIAGTPGTGQVTSVTINIEATIMSERALFE